MADAPGRESTDLTTSTEPSTDPEPVVSFVVPARNEADYIRGTLSSIATLDTAYAYEVLVVDGASTDGTADIAREYDVRVIEQDGWVSPRRATREPKPLVASGWPSSTRTREFGRTTSRSTWIGFGPGENGGRDVSPSNESVRSENWLSGPHPAGRTHLALLFVTLST